MYALLLVALVTAILAGIFAGVRFAPRLRSLDFGQQHCRTLMRLCLVIIIFGAFGQAPALSLAALFVMFVPFGVHFQLQELKERTNSRGTSSH